MWQEGITVASFGSPRQWRLGRPLGPLMEADRIVPLATLPSPPSLALGEASLSLARLRTSCWKVRDLLHPAHPSPTQFPHPLPLCFQRPVELLASASASGSGGSHCPWPVGGGLPCSPWKPQRRCRLPGPLEQGEMVVCCDGGSGQPACSNVPVSGRQACCLHLAGPRGLAWCP